VSTATPAAAPAARDGSDRAGAAPPGPAMPSGEAASPARDSFGSWFAAAAAEDSRGIHLVDRREGERLLTWREVVASARNVAGGLQAAGVEPGDRVALCFPTGEEFLAAFFGALLAGAAPSPLPAPLRFGDPGDQRRRLAAMTAASGCRLALAGGELLAGVREAVAGDPPRLGTAALGDLPAGSWNPPGVGDDGLGLVQFSSGTTADPKPIALTRGALAAQVAMLNGRWPTENGELARGASWLPLHHDMGLVGCLLPALALATDLTLLQPEVFAARPASWLRALSRSRATVSPAPTFGYALCLRKVRDEELLGVDLSAWRFALCGSEPVSADVLRAFATRFARWGLRPEALMPVYGLAEAALALTFGDAERPFTSRRWDRDALLAGRAEPDPEGRELVSVGQPLPGVALEIRDADGHPAAPATVGAVWAHSPCLMSGYLDRPAATAAVMRDGWLDTGDLGFLAAGELYLVGRAKDVVILRGRNHAAEEIEGALAHVAGLRPERVAAVGWLAEDAEEERLVLFVERQAGRAPGDDAALAAACDEVVLAAVGVSPARIEVVAPGTLPVTSSGKLRRQEALRRFLAGELGSGALGSGAASVAAPGVGTLGVSAPGVGAPGAGDREPV
jgi:fatty-acyl-CoA synthase